MVMTLLTRPRAPLWVIGGPRHPAALALAGRLELPFLRVPESVPDEAATPELVVSAGPAALARAIALRRRFGCRLVHCASGPRGFDPAALIGRRAGLDLVVRTAPVRRPDRIAGELTVLGPLHVVSPALLRIARRRWAERLDHLPRPLVALLVRRGGLRPLAPAPLHAVAVQVADHARRQGGAVLASVDRDSGAGAFAAVRHGLRTVLNLLHRTDEPGEDPTLGFLGSADAIVMAGAHAQSLSEAAAASVPVYVDPVDDFDRGGRRLLATLLGEDTVRSFTGSLVSWPERAPLDEAGRAATAIRHRVGLESG